MDVCAWYLICIICKKIMKTIDIAKDIVREMGSWYMGVEFASGGDCTKNVFL